ncbi:glycosyltransferase family 2 protein [Dyadobacter endophyticus]|uniref:glycosyltransferase family 2 protein n=1 Tax=Dyadobacter TaxID=120831 RepID=UPI003CF91816
MEELTRNPKVSIITVYYNRAYCVAQSVESLLNQTYVDFELLLVDDGSTDTTLAEFKKFDDPRIRIVAHPNMGFTNSMRKAIESARGEYIAVHGSGDISYEERISKQLEFLENNPEFLIVASRFDRYDEETLLKIEESTFHGAINYDDFVRNCRIMHGAAFFRKSAYDEAGGYEPVFRTQQDWDLFQRFLGKGKGIVLDDLLYKQYKRVDGVVASPSSYRKSSLTSALRIKLATNPSERQATIDKVKKDGIESVITDQNTDFQQSMIMISTMLAKRGKYKEFINFRDNIDVTKFRTSLKIKFYCWLMISKTIVSLRIDPSSSLKYISKFKYMKDRIRTQFSFNTKI